MCAGREGGGLGVGDAQGEQCTAGEPAVQVFGSKLVAWGTSPWPHAVLPPVWCLAPGGITWGGLAHAWRVKPTSCPWRDTPSCSPDLSPLPIHHAPMPWPHPQAMAQLSALIAGFAVAAFYDFNYSASPDHPVVPLFGAATALTVRVGWDNVVPRAQRGHQVPQVLCSLHGHKVSDHPVVPSFGAALTVKGRGTTDNKQARRDRRETGSFNLRGTPWPFAAADR